MKVDIGFWDINGNYIEDIQEINEIERKEIMKEEVKSFDYIFDELNDMVNNFPNCTNEEKDEGYIDKLENENEYLHCTLQEIKEIIKNKLYTDDIDREILQKIREVE